MGIFKGEKFSNLQWHLYSHLIPLQPCMYMYLYQLVASPLFLKLNIDFHYKQLRIDIQDVCVCTCGWLYLHVHVHEYVRVHACACAHQGSWPLLSEHASPNMLTQQFQWLDVVLQSLTIVLQTIFGICCSRAFGTFWPRLFTGCWLHPFATPSSATIASSGGSCCARGRGFTACRGNELSLSQAPYQCKTNTHPQTLQDTINDKITIHKA